MGSANTEAPVELFRGKHLKLLKRGRWEYAERTQASGAAVIIAVTDAGHLLLTEQFRLPVDKTVIELPAGLAGDVAGEESEVFIAAAKRELLEETGYEAQSFVPLLTGPSSAGLTSELISIFHATGLRRVSAGGGVDGEKITVHEVPLVDVDKWLSGRIKEGLLIDPKVYAGLWLIQRRR